MKTTITEDLKWRYATKKFDENKKLSKEKLIILKETFDLTATSYGLQPVKMVVVSDAKTIQKLVPMSFNQPQIGNASHILVLCSEMIVDTKFIKNYFDLVEKTRNTPRDILASFEDFLIDDFSKKSPEEIEAWGTNQIYLIMGNLLTVCAAEKIDSCPIEGFVPSEYDEFLGLTDMGLRSVLVLAVGYRAEDDMFSELKKVRRGVDEIVIDLDESMI